MMKEEQMDHITLQSCWCMYACDDYITYSKNMLTDTYLQVDAIQRFMCLGLSDIGFVKCLTSIF